MSEHIVLPYIPPHASRRFPFTAEMETAAIACKSETRRKKSRILVGKQEKTVAIAKLYYPLFLVPWESDCATIDRVKIFSFETTYGQLPDCDSIIADIEKNQKSFAQFTMWLEENAKTFKNFAGSTEVRQEGVIADKELLQTVFEYFKNEKSFKEQTVDEAAFLKERLEKKEALSKIDELANLSKKNQLDITALQKVLSALENAAGEISIEHQRNAEDAKKGFENEISRMKPTVEEKIRQLSSEKDSRIKTLTDSSNLHVEELTKERKEVKSQLETLESERIRFKEKKALAKLRKDQLRVKRWDFSLKERERRIADLRAKLRKLQEHIDHANTQKESDLKLTNATFEAQINAENNKIMTLEASMKAKIAEFHDTAKHMHLRVDHIRQDVRKLMEAKQAFAVRLKEIAMPWKIETPVSLLLPFYVVEYWSQTKERFEFHPPSVAASSDGMIKMIRRKFFGFSLDARINALLQQRSRALYRMFNSAFAKRIDADRELWNHVHELTQQNNLLSSSVFKETLVKGLDSLAAEKWIKSEERSMILQAFAKSFAK